MLGSPYKGYNCMLRAVFPECNTLWDVTSRCLIRTIPILVQYALKLAMARSLLSQ